jgi:hypothetical protein
VSSNFPLPSLYVAFRDDWMSMWLLTASVGQEGSGEEGRELL